PCTNPTTALITQSKRFPLLWDALHTPLPTWRRLLPVTRDPRAIPSDERDAWVLKPALGRVGEDIGMAGVTPPGEMQKIVRARIRNQCHWAAQQRFSAVPILAGETSWYPVLGVYTIDGRASGIYGRMSRRPLIDAKAQDVAVLIKPSGG